MVCVTECSACVVRVRVRACLSYACGRVSVAVTELSHTILQLVMCIVTCKSLLLRVITYWIYLSVLAATFMRSSLFLLR